MDTVILKKGYVAVAEARIAELAARKREVDARIKVDRTRRKRQLAESSLQVTLAEINQPLFDLPSPVDFKLPALNAETIKPRRDNAWLQKLARNGMRVCKRLPAATPA